MTATPTGKVQNLVLHDTTAGRQSSFVIELTQQADLSKAYAMKDQNARGWYVYRTLKRTAEKTQGPLKAMLDAQGVSYKSFCTPGVAIVLGSGLGQFAERLEHAVRVPYGEIPHFPSPTVIGHSGELVAGTLAGRTVLVQSGRFHMYEGHPASLTALPVRVFARLGVGTARADERRRRDPPELRLGHGDADRRSYQPDVPEPAVRRRPPGRGAVPRHVRSVRSGAARPGARGWRGSGRCRWPKGCTSGCSGRATRRRPRSGCWSGSARMRSGCPR